ncbi:MAG: hypothetical protein MUF85_02415 [Patescibacteria group bacterium]|jgi:hypothetical protein|nr:hypothetical protein [Patescibacteria group bacterium]
MSKETPGTLLLDEALSRQVYEGAKPVYPWARTLGLFTRIVAGLSVDYNINRFAAGNTAGLLVEYKSALDDPEVRRQIIDRLFGSPEPDPKLKILGDTMALGRYNGNAGREFNNIFPFRFPSARELVDKVKETGDQELALRALHSVNKTPPLTNNPIVAEWAVALSPVVGVDQRSDLYEMVRSTRFTISRVEASSRNSVIDLKPKIIFDIKADLEIRKAMLEAIKKAVEESSLDVVVSQWLNTLELIALSADDPLASICLGYLGFTGSPEEFRAKIQEDRIASQKRAEIIFSQDLIKTKAELETARRLDEIMEVERRAMVEQVVNNAFGEGG